MGWHEWNRKWMKWTGINDTKNWVEKMIGKRGKGKPLCISLNGKQTSLGERILGHYPNQLSRTRERAMQLRSMGTNIYLNLRRPPWFPLNCRVPHLYSYVSAGRLAKIVPWIHFTWIFFLISMIWFRTKVKGDNCKETMPCCSWGMIYELKS